MGDSRDHPDRPRVCIIGLGNRLRGDDGVGLHVAQRILQVAGGDVDVHFAEMAGVEVLDRLDGYDLVVLIDGAHTGAPAGTLHRWEVTEEHPRQHCCSHSSHTINALDAIKLARMLGRPLPRLVLYGVEVHQVDTGAGLSEAVAKTVEPAAQRIVHDAGRRRGA